MRSAALALSLALLTLSATSVLPLTRIDRAQDPDSTGTEQDQQESLLWYALDRESLFTLIGGLKPVSNGLVTLSMPKNEQDVQQIENFRALLAVLRNDEFYADILPFTSDHGNQRVLSSFLVHRASLARTIREHPDYFTPLGITPTSHPAQVITAIDALPSPENHRGYGYLFGYPDTAVDFYVDAERQHEATGKYPKREFRRVPTLEPHGGFVWAAPKGAPKNEAETRILERGKAIFEAYRAKRGEWQRSGRSALELMKVLRQELGGD